MSIAAVWLKLAANETGASEKQVKKMWRTIKCQKLSGFANVRHIRRGNIVEGYWTCQTLSNTWFNLAKFGQTFIKVSKFDIMWSNVVRTLCRPRILNIAKSTSIQLRTSPPKLGNHRQGFQQFGQMWNFFDMHFRSEVRAKKMHFRREEEKRKE